MAKGLSADPAFSRSRTPSRQRHSRNSSRAASIAYLPQDPESLALPEGGISAQASELLHEFVQPHHPRREAGERDPLLDIESPADDDSDTASLLIRGKLPWYKRPSPAWFLFVIPWASAAVAATAAPRVEIFTQLACAAHKPEYTVDRGNGTIEAVAHIVRAAAGRLSEADKRLCATDPVVGAAVAQLNMLMTLTLGVLSCITTAWWGSFSDRNGRKGALKFSTFGLLAADVNFILTVHFNRYLPGGYWFLLVGPFIDGLCGGMSALSGTIHAYIADCTDAPSRSRVFSLFLGLMFSGFGLGPTLGSIVIHFTGSPLSVFYIATVLHVFYASLVYFIIPESLSIRRQLESRKMRREENELASRAPRKALPLHILSKMFAFLTPLALFFPVSVDNQGFKKRNREWNLLLVAIAFGCMSLLIGSYTFKFQYTSAAFGWTSEQIGYWLSIVGATRAVHLTFILPAIIKYLKPKPDLPPIHLAPSSDSIRSSGTADGERRTPTSTDPIAHQIRSLPFDLKLARISMFIEVISYSLIAFAPNAGFFTVISMISAFGAGFSPAVQSVALGLYTLRGGTESGKLFGAMSVLSSLCSSIIGPTLFGMTYLKTVGTFPTAIFFVAAGAVILSSVVLSFVRLPQLDTISGHHGEETLVGAPAVHEQDDTLYDPEVPMIVVDDVQWKSNSPSASNQSSPNL